LIVSLIHLLCVLFFYIKLTLIKLIVEAFLFHKGFVISAFDHVSVLHDKDQVGVADSGKTMRDDKAGSSLCQLIHGSLDNDLGSCVYG